ncbi:urease accessory protein UreD [Fulvivirga sp. 29W222]|uniref:Urease accessory protein UreD n=1 Tax=Fulvivirga marina TaxID=2494733 RepID=A0A937G2F0_9BACT|nr:urease accessory protein UreD [Fulvivirga marina]MBL6449412.1 urease accessory protein UreD [Fulvivirga marina]
MIDIVETTTDRSEIEVAWVRGKSELITCKNIQPLKILHPDSHNSTCHLVLSNYGGGMVAADLINIRVKCGTNTRTFISSQSNTRIYKKISNTLTEQNVEGEIAEDALVVVFPDPVVLQAESRFSQSQHWEVGRGGLLFLVDWFQAGRTDSGEKYQFDTYLSEIKVSVEGKLLVLDRFSFSPQENIADSPANFGQYQSMLSIYLAGFPDDLRFNKIADKLQEIRSANMPALNYDIDNNDYVISVTRAREGVYILRAMGKSRMDLQSLCEDLMNMFSETVLLGYNPMKRKF